MTVTRMTKRLTQMLLSLFLLGMIAEEAEAVVGRPMTPVSYAGVARRTSRRTVRRTAYASGGYGYGAGYVTALPAGCVMTAGGVYQCGGSVYRPYYDGPNLVYVVE